MRVYVQSAFRHYELRVSAGVAASISSKPFRIFSGVCRFLSQGKFTDSSRFTYLLCTCTVPRTCSRRETACNEAAECACHFPLTCRRILGPASPGSLQITSQLLTALQRLVRFSTSFRSLPLYSTTFLDDSFGVLLRALVLRDVVDWPFASRIGTWIQARSSLLFGSGWSDEAGIYPGQKNQRKGMEPGLGSLLPDTHVGV